MLFSGPLYHTILRGSYTTLLSKFNIIYQKFRKRANNEKRKIMRSLYPAERESDAVIDRESPEWTDGARIKGREPCGATAFMGRLIKQILAIMGVNSDFSEVVLSVASGISIYF